VTLRAKTDYVQEKDKDGRTVIRKVGLAPIQREGLEYEFDVVGDMDLDNTLAVTKSRCSALNRAVIREPGEALGQTLADWLAGPAVSEVHAYVQGEADRCATVDQLSALRKSLESRGGSYWTDGVKEILKATFERLKAPTQAPAAAAAATATEAPAPAAAEATEEQKVRKAIASVALLLKDCKSPEDFAGVEAMRIKEGGVYLHPDVARLVEDAQKPQAEAAAA
jgi:hypothetical protein